MRSRRSSSRSKPSASACYTTYSISRVYHRSENIYYFYLAGYAPGYSYGCMQGLSFIGPFVDTTLLECEIDEEVFIPKSFSPLLEGGIGGNLQVSHR